MSVADRKGYLRRFKLLQRKGHAPHKAWTPIHEAIERGKMAQKKKMKIRGSDF